MSITALFFYIHCIFFAWIDFKTGFVSRYNIFLAIIGLIALRFYYYGINAFILSLEGCICGILFFYLVRILTNKGLGLADVWVSGFLGTYLDPTKWYNAILSACILASMFCIFTKKRKIPFIPFITAGTIAADSIALFKG